jgi:hypothetical protein
MKKTRWILLNLTHFYEYDSSQHHEKTTKNEGL